MQDEELLRYSRHILLDAIGIEGQERICQAHALIVGAGGLGCPASMYLAAAGVGHITVMDADTVDLTNLQRQIAHTTARVGESKVASVQHTLQALNPHTQVHALPLRADAALLAQYVPHVDVVLDCSDNFATRQLVNAACVRHCKPLVFAAAVQWDGQIGVVDPRNAHSACYACIFPPSEVPPATACATMGIFAPLVGILGSMQAAQALQLVAQVGEPLRTRLLMLDGLRMEWTSIRTAPAAQCPVCSSTH
jgi:molybdopterin-synthase adenylyltransferase